MKSKNNDYQKSNFKKGNKKSIVLILLILFVAFASSQPLVKDKNKIAIQKDTVKKNKIVLEEQETVLDTLLVEKGKFKLYKKTAHASYYADKFHGRKTASGKKYDKTKYTAAHKKLPFGTKVKVTNEANGKVIIVEITDRGPFVRSREIDLSRRAFMEITTNKSSGSMLVTLEVLQK